MSTIKVLVRHGSLLKKTVQPWPYLDNALTKFQDPVEADKLLKIQRELDETNIILHKTIYSVLARGEKLNSLVEKTSMMVFISMAPPSQFLLLRMEKPQKRLIMDSSLEKVFGVVNDAVKSGGIYVDAATIFDRQKNSYRCLCPDADEKAVIIKL